MDKRLIKQKKPKKGVWKDPKRREFLSITVFVIGVMTLAVGIGCLAARLMQGSDIADGEYLVAAGEWKLQSSTVKMLTCTDDLPRSSCSDDGEKSEVMHNDDNVVWDFTEIGKGTLTTNAHQNDYDFRWALEDGKLLINTDWLYELENEYDYVLDQRDGILTLKADGEEYKFVAQ